ncbi:MAG TPA: glycosyltransferase family A protein [Candidatus Saccharimonadales bacterium]|nr:glycosyltransferase family A protein [Candidatus Saccharimonadales bacterium]
MKASPTVSIIMPTFNRAYTIKDAINSIVDQSYKNWELIVVDDGSTDNTKSLINSIGDERIKYLSQHNQGPAVARNFGISEAKGKWIAYLDSDNEFLSKYLEVMLDSLDIHPRVVFAIPRLNYSLELYEKGKLIRSIDHSSKIPVNLSIEDIFLKTFHFDTNGLIHLRELFDEGIKWDKAMCGMEDWELALTIGDKYPEGFLYVPVKLANYHQRYGGDGMVSNHNYQEIADAFEQIYQKHRNDSLLAGQDWYPAKVLKWQKLQKESDEGKQPPFYQYYFQDID